LYVSIVCCGHRQHLACDISRHRGCARHRGINGSTRDAPRSRGALSNDGARVASSYAYKARGKARQRRRGVALSRRRRVHNVASRRWWRRNGRRGGGVGNSGAWVMATGHGGVIWRGDKQMVSR